MITSSLQERQRFLFEESGIDACLRGFFQLILGLTELDKASLHGCRGLPGDEAFFVEIKDQWEGSFMHAEQTRNRPIRDVQLRVRLAGEVNINELDGVQPSEGPSDL